VRRGARDRFDSGRLQQISIAEKLNMHGIVKYFGQSPGQIMIVRRRPSDKSFSITQYGMIYANC